ncbi:lactate dehydrogenase [Chromatiales bacterium (ex Bugula neritina AB1)]|nr:lactate dehydrogenase [Chromatiales bacterium (ex Bugula neritina AB1)]
MTHTLASTRNVQLASEVLKQRFGERFLTGDSIREQHAHTLTYLRNQPPDAVVYAENSSDVALIVEICAEHNCPVIPFGTGSSLEGQLNAPEGGVSIDMSQMNEVVEIHPEDLTVTVQPGITRKALNSYLRDTGLFFPIDPGADASIGGMASTRASGTNAVRYGTMKDNVLGVRAVMADGREIKTASRARKTAAGYDLTRLLVGSEGTLGVITEVTLKLHGLPESVAGGICNFPDISSACQAAIQTIQYGIPIARIELLDPVQVAACNAYSKLNLAEKPTVFVEFHGSDASTAEQSAMFGEIVSDCGGSDFQWTSDEEKRSKLWQARHDAYWAARGLRPSAEAIVTDACVPISQLAACVEQTCQDIKEHNLLAPIVGHVGDGNFHTSVLVDMNSESELLEAKQFAERLSHRAISMGGTCTGEHGIGQGKKAYLREELGDTVDFMATIKAAMDPGNIMNPGKIF